MKKPKIGIVGLGMVGEPLRRYLEECRGYKRGVNLFCFDADASKGYLDSMEKTDIVFISVPTPSRSDGSCNVNAVHQAATECIKQNSSCIFVMRSTVVPGTCDALAELSGRPVIFWPEFLTEANAWENFLHPERQIFGTTAGSEEHVPLIMSLVPEPWQENFFVMGATEAELVKYRSNLFGALKVCFANQVAVLAELYSAVSGARIDAQKILDAIGLDHRIGPYWLKLDYHGYRGYGGYCFTKDTNAQIEEDLRHLAQLKDSELYSLASASIRAIKADRDFNRALLKSQGLTEEDVNKHDAELSQKVETIKRVQRSKKEQ